MLNEKFLLDDFEVSGINVDDFEVLIRELDQHTAHVKRCLNNFVIVSIKGHNSQGSNEISGWYLEPDNPSNNGVLKSCIIPKSNNLCGHMNELLKETIHVNPTMLWDRERNAMWFVSSSATNTMAQRIGVTGKSIREHSLERDLFIAKRFNIDVTSTLIVKQYQQVGKVFSMMSEDYVHIPLYMLCIIYKDLAGESRLGAMECEGWNVTHERVSISFSFKEYAQQIRTIYNLKREMVPCVELTTSDIGESSFIVRGYWHTPEGARIYDRTFKRQHRGKVDPDMIVKEVQKHIFNKYNELPERLVELAEIDVTPADLDLSGARDSGKNHKIVCSTFRSVFKQLRLVDVIGKKKLMYLERYLDFSIVRGDRHYTAYDIVMDIFSLSGAITSCFETEDVSQETIRKFREEISKAAYVDFRQNEQFTEGYQTL